MEHFFTTYVRTKLVFQRRLKDLLDYDRVKIHAYELRKLGVSDRTLEYLQRTNQIGVQGKLFWVLRPGPVVPAILERTKPLKKGVLTPLHLYMRDQLRYVTLPPDMHGDLSVYFKAFLEHRNESLASFFSVDSFSGRVHTPIVNLKGALRRSLIFHGKRVVSLDVKQMQPTILAKVLYEAIGQNSFSSAIFNGEDVYNVLKESAQLETRDEAKKFLFKLIFGAPKDDIKQMFKGDDVEWVTWINEYKSNVEYNNPHKAKPHTNLAWLLQYSEVRVMTEIWNVLKNEAIPFLTIHDDILCPVPYKDKVYVVMQRILGSHFKEYSIHVTEYT